MIQLHQRPIGVSRSQYREIYIESRPAITWIFQNILGGKAVLDGLRHVQIGSWHGNVRRNSNRNWHFLHLAPEGQDWVCDPFGYVQILGGYINFPISISFSLCTHALTYIYIYAICFNSICTTNIYRNMHWIQNVYIYIYMQDMCK